MGTDLILAALRRVTVDASDVPPTHHRAAIDDVAPPFMAEGRIPASSLGITVDGLGTLPMPMSAGDAAALAAFGRPSPVGLGEDTVLDVRVRDSGEVCADLLGLQWADGAFAALQDTVARGLGLAALQASASKLLVYGPGQFFKPHQDSEHVDGMVATLVLVWPSAHVGGTLNVRHRDGARSFKSQQLGAGSAGQAELRWCAFYADCRHEVEVVEEGWRVALTFDLSVPQTALAAGDAHAPPAPPDPALVQALAEHVDGAAGEPPPPWVLLLDHEYTQHGLRWHLLKGADRLRVQALRAAAEAQGWVVHLALAELHQTWSALDTGPRRRGRWHDPDDEDDDDRGDGVSPEALIDESLTLEHWVDGRGPVPGAASLTVRTDSVASFTPTDEAHLVDEEYQGYTGNEGQTLDYWYRRAAVVLQHPTTAERTRFEIDFPRAFDALVALARRVLRDDRPAAPDAGQLTHRTAAGARAIARAAERAGRDDGTGRTRSRLWADCALIAGALRDDRLALRIATAFDPTLFEPVDAEPLALLQARRGAAWLGELAEAWSDRSPVAPGWVSQETTGRGVRASWPRPLTAWMQACVAAGLSQAWRQAQQTAWLRSLVQQAARMQVATPAARAETRGAGLDAVCELALALQVTPSDDRALDALIAQVLAMPVVFPVKTLAPFVQACGERARHTPVQQPLQAQVTAALAAALRASAREPDDHALRDVAWTCRCHDCRAAIAWAESARAEPLTMPLAESRRQHVQGMLAASASGIACETLRQGSPYKLVLSKPADLHAREAALRATWEAALRRL